MRKFALLTVIFFSATSEGYSYYPWGGPPASNYRGPGGHNGGLLSIFHRGGQNLPVFQAAPWYLYWPYDAHFMTPAPYTGAFYPPPQQGYGGMQPYFPQQGGYGSGMPMYQGGGMPYYQGGGGGGTQPPIMVDPVLPTPKNGGEGGLNPKKSGGGGEGGLNPKNGGEGGLNPKSGPIDITPRPSQPKILPPIN